ncbi:Rv3654c family TadE-like protein [Streptomyces sp. NPDC045431]|uniref:Rv3654c family TadE-like protein n=1 Tax=Streptomyces sp. NPDC045431 TaxID=3155613 RepID=UPI0033D7DD89
MRRPARSPAPADAGSACRREDRGEVRGAADPARSPDPADAGSAWRREDRGKVRGAADRGVATVWVVMAASVLCTVFAVVLALGQAVAARHRAGGAADLAALAAADLALWGGEHACAAAARVARAQQAEVVRCAVRGEIAEVTARARFGPYAPQVRSRAGPPRGQPGLPAAVP